MTILEAVGFVTGALCVWLLVEQSVRTFPVAIVNNLIFVVVFGRAGLYADAGLQIVYIALSSLGWYWWLHGGPDQGGLKAKRTPLLAWPLTAIGVALGTGLLYLFLRTHTDSTVPGLDGLTTSLSLAAQAMQSRKWIGNWYLWIIADVVYIGLYASKGLWLTAVLYAVYLGMCVHGVREWTRSMHAAPAPAAAPPGPPPAPAAG